MADKEAGVGGVLLSGVEGVGPLPGVLGVPRTLFGFGRSRKLFPTRAATSSADQPK